MTEKKLNGPFFVPDNAESALIFLHGYGSDGDELFENAPMIRRFFPKTALFCPNGAQEGLWGGRQWFDLSYYPAVVDENIAFLKSFFARMLPDAVCVSATCAAYVDEITLKTGIPVSKMALAGFSQGGLIALLTGLTMEKAPACVIGMSACAISETAGVFTAENVVSKPSVALVHGTADPVVPLPATDLTVDFLNRAGVPVDRFIVDGMGHCIDARAGEFLLKMLEKFL